MSFSRFVVIPYLLKHRRPVIPYTVRRKNYRASNRENTLVFKQEYRKCGSSVRFSNPALLLPQQCCFSKSNAAFAATVFLSQIQHCFRPSSAAFSNPAVQTRQEH